MTTTETSKLRTIAGVIGVGSLALFGATACDNAGTEQEDGGGLPGEDTTQEEQMPTEDGPAEDESLEEQEDT